MPLYNQERLFKIGLDSIPPREDIEIIVIDDGSTDDSLEEVRNYQLTSPKNITVLRNERNMGVAYSVNKGFDHAKGEYIVLLGSDGDYFVDLDNALNCLETDLVYFQLQINSGEFLETKSGSSKFMRREFIGDTRCPLIKNCEDNEFYSLLMKKNPTESYLNRNIMYKHYNYPRRGSLVWNVEHGITQRKEKC